MRKALSLVMAFLLMTGLVAGLQGKASAQSTPAGGTTIYDSSGNEAATISVDSITDPFSAYDQGYEPQSGFRYVLLTITITNTGTAPYYTQPYGFSVVDEDGFTATSAYISYSDDSIAEQLADTTLATGDSETGTVAFQLLEGTSLSAINYAPGYDRMYTLASSGVAPAIGEAVPMLGDDGGQIGTITVGDIADPLEDVDPSYGAPRGFHYIGVTVTIENTSRRPLSIDPSTIDVVDNQGFVNSSYGAYRTEEATTATPDLQYADLAPGDTMTGLISYTIFSGAEPAWLIWSGSSGSQFIVVAAFDGAPAIPAIDDIPTEAGVAAGTATSTVTADETPVAGITPSASATESAQLSPECQVLADWADEVNAAITGYNDDTITISDASELEAMSVDDLNAAIDTRNDFLDELDAIDTPDAAEDVANALEDVINLEIDGLQEVIDAKESNGDLQAIIDEYQPKIDDATNTFLTAANVLDTQCKGVLD